MSLRLQGGEDGERVVYHKDMWSEKDYDHQGFGALMKKVNGYVLRIVSFAGALGVGVERNWANGLACLGIS